MVGLGIALAYLLMGFGVGRWTFIRMLGDDERYTGSGYWTEEYVHAFWGMVAAVFLWPLFILLLPFGMLIGETPAEKKREQQRELEKAKRILEPNRGETKKEKHARLGRYGYDGLTDLDRERYRGSY